MTDSKQSERQRRYYIRKKAQALALMGGGTEIELAWFGTNRDGEHVAIGMDGQRIELRVMTGAAIGDGRINPEDPPVDEVSARRAARPKRVYAPKSWPAEKWNTVVGQLREQDFTKDEARRELANAKTLDAKQIRHALAVVDAMPDAPDWYAHMPVAEV